MKMAKNRYDGLCKKLVEAIASKQEARRGQDYEESKHSIIRNFKEALEELKGHYNTKVSIDFLIDLAYASVELTKKQIYDKVRWLVKKAEINLEDSSYYFTRWHRYGDGTAGKIYPNKILKFLAV